MNKIDNSIDRINELLSLEVPSKYCDHITKFNELVSKDLLRAAYSELDELRRKSDWNPSASLEGAIINFQRVF